jgi:DNA polymerase III epsilon subunit-like protein
MRTEEEEDDSSNKCIFIDVETNGIGPFRPARQRVVQLGWLFREKKGSFFINDITEVSDKVPHPYDVEYCKENGISFVIGLQEFFEDLKLSSHIVAHNAKFDIGCLLNELKIRKCVKTNELYSNIELEIKKKKVMDTMIETVEICKLEGKFGYKWPKLEELYVYCFSKSPNVVLHDAVNDCIVTRDCLNFLLERKMLCLN